MTLVTTLVVAIPGEADRVDGGFRQAARYAGAGPARSRRWWLVVALVLLIHVAGWWVWPPSVRLRARSVVPGRMSLRWLPVPIVPRQLAAAPVQHRRGMGHTDLRPSTAARVAPPEPAAITLPVADPASSNAAVLPDTTAARPGAGPAGVITAVPLNLHVPHAASAPLSVLQQAVRDPRGNVNSREATLGEALNRRLANGGPVTEEPLAGEGAVRVRQGASCVQVHRSRGAILNPFDPSSATAAAGVEGCP